MSRTVPLRLLPLIVLAASALVASDAVAQRADQEEPQTGTRDARQLSREAPRDMRRAERRGHDRSAEQRALSAAVRRVESRTGGQVLSAERIPFDGRDVSRIKVVDSSGRVRVYMDDPQGAAGRGSPPEPRPTRRDDN